MNLFDFQTEPTKNILPYDGIVNYFGKVFSWEESEKYYHYLLNEINWRNDEAIIFGRKLITKRKVAWYGDKDYEYTYSNSTKKALPWTQELIELKNRTEKICNESYNSCLLNLYHTGEEGMAWHSDDERDLKKHGAIGSLTFGSERKFGFKHKKTKETIFITLEQGSLLVMKGSTQDYWLHRLPTTTKIHTPRINLTFRWMV